METEAKKKDKPAVAVAKKAVTTMDAAWERADEEEKKLEGTGETPMALTKEDREEEALAGVVYPSSYPVATPLQLQWWTRRSRRARVF